MAKASRLKLFGVDQVTGEVIDNPSFPYSGKKAWKNGFMEGWSTIGNGASLALASSSLTGEDYRVMFYVLGRSELGNAYRDTPQQASAALKMPRQNYDRAMRHLREAGIIYRNYQHDWMLNPAAAWKGNGEGHIEALRACPPTSIKKRAKKSFRSPSPNQQTKDQHGNPL